MESPRLGFAFSLVAVSGILITSFSMTYGLWSGSHPIGYYINHHAIYIAASGMGLLCSLGINLSLQKRLDALESVVNHMNAAK